MVLEAFSSLNTVFEMKFRPLVDEIRLSLHVNLLKSVHFPLLPIDGKHREYGHFEFSATPISVKCASH